MAFSWGEILEEIRDHLNEPSQAFFPNTYLLAQWNRMQLKFSQEVRHLRKERDFPFQSDKITVILPFDFLGLISIGIKNGSDEIKSLSPVPLEGRSKTSLMGISYFLIDNRRIRITDSAGDDDKMVVVYFGLPEPFADETDLEQETEISDEHVDVVIMGVVFRALRKRRDTEDSLLAERTWKEGLSDAIRLESVKKGSKKRIIIR